MYKCPHCNKPGISVWRKAFLGPAVPATCRQCGKKVGVPYLLALFALIPLVIAICLSAFVGDSMLTAVIWVAGFFIAEAIYLKWVPLIPK